MNMPADVEHPQSIVASHIVACNGKIGFSLGKTRSSQMDKKYAVPQRKGNF
jgi:hypothetical protein